MPDYVTDTHGLIWYLEDSPRLGIQARACFAACDRGECIIYVLRISSRIRAVIRSLSVVGHQ